jgi:uncharacterized protein YlzI (FlbEa/FlbD family)
LEYLGGLGQITTPSFSPELQKYTIPFIEPPITHSGLTTPIQEIVALNDKWLETKRYRRGQLIISVNGKRFFVVDDVEEIIPRALNTPRQRQIGVPFNMSWGGGTQGLHENLTFTACPITLTGLTYQQDPECFPTYILSGTSLSGLTTDILLERYFGGTFDGGISQFRFYIEPLSIPEIRHNFNLLKSQFSMFDPFCPSCEVFTNTFFYELSCTVSKKEVYIDSTSYSGQSCYVTVLNTSGVTENLGLQTIPFSHEIDIDETVQFFIYVPSVDNTFIIEIDGGPCPTPTPTNTMTPTPTPTVTTGLTPTATPTQTKTPTMSPTNSPTPSFTPTPSPTTYENLLLQENLFLIQQEDNFGIIIE